MKKVILTGDRPTGRLHVGHYAGSLKERLSKNAFLHFAQMHPLVFVCFDTLLSLCSKKSH